MMASPIDPTSRPGAPRRLWTLFRRYQNIVIFFGGFAFDLVTVTRPDSVPDLAMQIAYLIALTILLIYQYRDHVGHWHPSGRIQRVWHYNVEALHFCYGGLLSNYVCLYMKSSTGARPVVFFILLAVLMVANEMPQVQRLGYRLRLGLFAFCVASFLIYFVPVVVGRMNFIVFLASIALSGFCVWKVATKLASASADPVAHRRRLFAPAAAVLVVILTLDVLKLIPPVPLSVQWQGVYHAVVREDGHYVLRARKPPWNLFWRTDSRPFRFEPGDQMNYFVRIFAPRRFHATVFIQWESYDERARRWISRDKIPLSVVGGRGAGFRGYASKSRFEPGRWRVWTETDDGRPLAVLSFRVVPDTAGADRAWIESKM